ncbi:MAG: hypothetical protein JWQ70_946 [Aeromicrobium sp.]|nr:hypothetical protein [Aeromicrobium sp.]
MTNMKRFNAADEEIKPGLRQSHPTNFESIKFDYYVVLDAEQPDRWHGEVLLRGRTIITTGQHPNELIAGRAAESALLERLIGALSD